MAKFDNWNNDMEPGRRNRDGEESLTTATPTAPEERGEEEDVERLHMYVSIFNLEQSSSSGCK